MSRAPEVEAVLMLGAGSTTPAVACTRTPGTLHDRRELVKRRVKTFAEWSFEHQEGDTGTLQTMGFYLRTIVTGEPGLWCFGAELEPNAKSTLWLLVDRSSAQGLGWAYLTALVRAVTRHSGERPSVARRTSTPPEVTAGGAP
jgi:hypothetical protein